MEKFIVLALVSVIPAVFGNDCSQGDNPNYRINGKYCDQMGYDRNLCYHASVARECCASCNRLKIPGASAGCAWGDKMQGCNQLTSRQCRTPNYNEVCCHTCRGTDKYCRDDPSVTINGYKCSEFLRYKGAHNCYQGNVLNFCCSSCEQLKRSNSDTCKYGDKKQKQFRDSYNGVVYRCENLSAGWLHKCAQASVREDCCETCRNWEQYRQKRTEPADDEVIDDGEADKITITTDRK